MQRELKGQRLNELALWDLGNDKVFEIFTTDVSGNVACYSADTLETLWARSIGKDSLTAPVIGHFLGPGKPVLAFGSSSGKVYFLWPGSGETIATMDSGLEFILAPSVARRGDVEELILADDKGHVAGFALDAQTGLPRETFRVGNTAKDAATFSVIGSMAQPPSCFDLNGDGASEIILASDTGFLQVISLLPDVSAEPRRFHTRMTQNTRVTTLAGVGDFAQDQSPLFGYGVGTSLQFFSWDDTAEPAKAIQQAINATAFGNSHGHLLVGQVNADAAPDLVSTAESTVAARYIGSDLSGGKTLVDIGSQHLSTTAPPFSPAAPVTLASGGKAIVAIDNTGTVFVWQPTENTAAQRFPGAPVPTTFTPAGDLTGSGKLAMVTWNEKDFTLSVVTLPVEVAPTNAAAPAVTLGGNYSRSGQWGDAWHQEWTKQMAALGNVLSEVKASATAETEDDARLSTDAISIIAGIAPNDPLAAKLKIDRINNGTGLYTAGGVVLLVIILAGGFYYMKTRRG